jgi:hypothetical protein
VILAGSGLISGHVPSRIAVPTPLDCMSEGAISPVSSDASGRVRARAEARLQRVEPTGAGVRPLDDRGIVLRLAERSVDDAQVRTSPGDAIAAHALGVRERVVTLKTAPNAPLLMRIVRTPYALPTTRGRRLNLMDRTRTERPERLGRPGLAWTSFRVGRLFRSPLRSVEHGMPQRLHPRRPAGEVAP